jgi:hypothetical protein
MRENEIMLNIKVLLLITLICITTIYYIFLTPEVIYKIIVDEYIFLGIMILLSIVFFYYKIKLKDFIIVSYLPNLNHVDFKTTFIFFLIFQVVDFYYEDGFIGMISQWFIYWVFAVIAWLLTNNINFYKNYRFHKI